MIARPLVPTPRAPDGLFIQPKEVGPHREQIELHNRERAVKHGKYADHLCGDPNTLDPTGNYPCGTCNNVEGNKCVLVSVPEIPSLQASSCGEWEVKRAGDFEKWLKALSVDAASFATAADGEGWGCKRCPYQEMAVAPDSAGRTIYCRVWECRVDIKVGCCKVNGNEALPIPASWDTEMDPDDPWEQGEEERSEGRANRMYAKGKQPA